MRWKYPRVEDWIRECRRIPGGDEDNLILFTGQVRSGKSTFAYQVLKALDPTFGPHRVAFRIKDFLILAKSTPAGGAILLDEANLFATETMSKITKLFFEHLKDCGALNQHIGICFPWREKFHNGIKTYRLRWNVDMPRRGLACLHEPRHIRWQSRDGEGLTVRWPKVGAWETDKNEGPEWQAYLAAKELHMRTHGVLSDEAEEEDDAESPPPIDAEQRARMLADLEELSRRYDHNRAAKSPGAIRDRP